MNNPLEELREMKLQDLYTKLQLTDNEFDECFTKWGYYMEHSFATTAVIQWFLMKEIVFEYATSAISAK
jgi:endonuclease III-like uncharacterized protein